MQTDTALTDPLVEASSPDRPFYALGVMLDANDFTDEQTYHRARLARALQFLHGTGTVAGLGVSYVAALPVGSPDAPDGQAEELRVEPGLALDGLGRLIEVPRAACITLPRWWDAQTNDAVTAAFKAAKSGVVADVFVRFVACGRARTPAFASGPFDALDASVYARVRDGYELKLVPRPEDAPPTPPDPWAAITGATPADRLTSARAAVLGMWTTIEARTDRAVVPATLGSDLDWLLLARIVFPATLNSGDARPTRGAAAPTVDNNVRAIVLTVGALAHVVGS
jgi:hypothetical protein